MSRQRSTASLGGIALARRNSERKPGNRRESVLPEEVLEELGRRPPKPFMRQPRALSADDIVTRLAAESSGEDEPTSDSYYLHLHDLEQAKKEHADRGVAQIMSSSLLSHDRNFTRTRVYQATMAKGSERDFFFQ